MDKEVVELAKTIGVPLITGFIGFTSALAGQVLQRGADLRKEGRQVTRERLEAKSQATRDVVTKMLESKTECAFVRVALDNVDRLGATAPKDPTPEVQKVWMQAMERVGGDGQSLFVDLRKSSLAAVQAAERVGLLPEGIRIAGEETRDLSAIVNKWRLGILARSSRIEEAVKPDVDISQGIISACRSAEESFDHQINLIYVRGNRRKAKKTKGQISPSALVAPKD